MSGRELPFVGEKRQAFQRLGERFGILAGVSCPQVYKMQHSGAIYFLGYLLIFTRFAAAIIDSASRSAAVAPIGVCLLVAIRSSFRSWLAVSSIVILIWILLI